MKAPQNYNDNIGQSCSHLLVSSSSPYSFIPLETTSNFALNSRFPAGEHPVAPGTSSTSCSNFGQRADGVLKIDPSSGEFLPSYVLVEPKRPREGEAPPPTRPTFRQATGTAKVVSASTLWPPVHFPKRGGR